jgi:hypothetical protein
VTAWLALDAQDLDRKAADSQANQQASTRDELADRASGRRLAAVMVGVGSGLVIAGGLALALWPSEDHAPERAVWNLHVTPNGVAVAGRF